VQFFRHAAFDHQCGGANAAKCGSEIEVKIHCVDFSNGPPALNRFNRTLLLTPKRLIIDLGGPQHRGLPPERGKRAEV
jgi:hypothetical protein